MTDVDEIIDYIKSLRRGFDKELFQSKIDELGYYVDTTGLDYDDFYTLFKVWLNLSIPIPKWMNLGACIVPQDIVKQNTVEYSLKWILGHYDNPNSTTRTAFVLDWLTAAMDTNSIDMNALDIGYEVFYNMLTYEALTVHVMKLLYTLTEPSDVTRKRVLELIDLAKKREGKKNMYRQIQVLLGLFKSYKPQYVPENVPSISIHTAFRKINEKLLMRFKNSQLKRNIMEKEKTTYLSWSNPLNSMAGNKKVDPLVPNMAFVNIGSQCDNSLQKTYLDFSDSVSLVQYSSQHVMRRPARLRALLCNPVGLTLLVNASSVDYTFLSHDLHHLLNNCFLEASPYSYIEKQDLLKRLATFQATLLQGVPIVTRFLAQFLPFWNERDFFSEILKLVEWVNVEDSEHIQVILNTLAKIYYRAQPLEQCAILNSVTNMYTNILYVSTRRCHYFLDITILEDTFTNILTLVASHISDMSSKGLQITPDSVCVMNTVLRSSTKRARFELYCGRGVGSIPRLLSLAIPLLSVSPAALDAIAEHIILYKEIYSATKAKSGRNDQKCTDQKMILKRYTADFISCFCEEYLNGRNKGIVFSKLHPQVVGKMNALIPDADSKLSIRNHLAFARYTYIQAQDIDARDASNKVWFHTVIDEEFDGLSQFLKQAMPELH